MKWLCQGMTITLPLSYDIMLVDRKRKGNRRDAKDIAQRTNNFPNLHIRLRMWGSSLASFLPTMNIIWECATAAKEFVRSLPGISRWEALHEGVPAGVVKLAAYSCIPADNNACTMFVEQLLWHLWEFTLSTTTVWGSRKISTFCNAHWMGAISAFVDVLNGVK